MKTLFADPTPRWVPFTAAAMIVIGVWGAGVWENMEFAFITRFAVGLACVLFVLIFFQGRFFWKGQVDRLSGDGEYFEALTSIWVGRGQRIDFGRHEATGWRATSSSSRKEGEPARLSTIRFTAKGKTLEMSFLNPKRVDLEGLSGLNPAFFGQVRADYPGLASVQ